MERKIVNIDFAKVIELDISEENFEKGTKIAEEMDMKFDDYLLYLMKKHNEEYRKKEH